MTRTLFLSALTLPTRTHRFLARVNGGLSACVALMCMAALLLTSVTTGCTPAQKQTTLQVVTSIYANMDTVISAADTAAAAVAFLTPADAVLVGVADTAFDVDARALKALAAAYIASPNATTLQQLQTAINTLESQLNTTTLNANKIVDLKTQQIILVGVKGLLTAVTLVFQKIAPTESTSMLLDLRRSDTIHLARVRQYMDQQQLQQAATDAGVNVDAAFAQATAFGF